MKEIKINGAKIHNLKNIDVSIPKDKLVVATGVSGSGKSSLMFDIVFEEGRKQYLQSLGILAGIDSEDKFDNIQGLAPTIAVQQNIIRQSNPRSTVGTRTNILNMLTLLYSVEGQIMCTMCDTPVNDNLICNNCGYEEERLKPSYFSYNSSDGMCMKCSGHGAYFKINIEKLVLDKHDTLKQVLDRAKITPGYLRVFSKKFNDYLDIQFLQLPEEVKNEVLYGHYENGKKSSSLSKVFHNRYKRGEDLNGVYTMTACSDCNGFKIGEEARRVLLNGKHIGELGKMTILEIDDFLKLLIDQGNLNTFGTNLVNDILSKTRHLIESRLGHLSLYREISTLSGGEMQRLFLNSHLDSEMDSLIYVLDEPTAGLHESEKIDILKSIKKLKDLGNTVIVVEHDKNTIEMAEHIIDIGPKAGIEGGQLVYQGDLEGLLQSDKSLTGQYISGKYPMPNRTSNKNITHTDEIPCITIQNANTNNLKNVTVSLPLGAMVGISGKSGSGKSSLISDTLLPLLRSQFNNHTINNQINSSESEIGDEYDYAVVETIADRLIGTKHISGYSEISQSPIGKNMNSTPASYIGIWDKIRTLFAGQPESLERGFTSGHFSFNSKGACPKCSGSGYEKVWLGNNLSIDHICSDCHGKRFNDESLSIKYKNKTIHDILNMSISEAVNFFKDIPNIVSHLNVLEQIGMGYIKLGQPTPTLSGGESQRIKLAKEIGKKRNGNILYVLDEPTTGLSLYDTAKLIQLLDELVANGNSVIVVEHDIDVLNVCDWIVELGPEGGDKGGYIIAEGSPKTLKENPKSITGRYL
ncbi:UvrABC system protein A 2 (UvrA protein 2) (Excinuclease ABC subunit A 2) [Clostridioides difficile]|uniref:excinuclease ABC subunit UvrA n=1 Tax=Clostridioides difficile TaxID=1496 RepID=UPI000D1DF05C|nr:excinuclease ABC subunit UvrA [Clostridioides difficile]UWD41347.1 excinuclease ABC subunit UvrA [Clostridioides difficile]VFF94866.1 UvrABC system protein A 2 (UvrA protein 2) (Excinuclease ABC subunit A 2) [Clostridioides difficile]VIG13437.1 UvrABC system protein A 2 (UvrA protein 2) (Excinuclease ABC subunit A 2) [Clostridioides difficile]HBE9438080.1 excinuclease ABC subunit UvrA [Clostridioides difficile]HBF4437314.1 excinuclease ABC subunit UvrA [Clostridioides difficile]